MSIASIKKDNITTRIDFSGEILISKLIKDFSVPMPCGGNHTCGKCKVKTFGNISPISMGERKVLTKLELDNNIRLACATSVFGDCEIEVSSIASDNSSVLLQGTQASLSAEGYAIAVDIGTTTIAVYLYQDGKLLHSIGELNNQSQFGADVITRIGIYEHKKLQHTILSQLNMMFERLIEHIAVSSQITQIVITGNTTMLHFLMGYDPSSIAVYPFTAHSLFDMQVLASTLFECYYHAMLYLPPCISSYVGADMVCSMMTSTMCDEKESVSILADIGTNGEMALQHNGKLYTCSTAAGPALEGATIQMGMVAAKGAIDHVELSSDGTILIHTIGEGQAVGICGSGLITLIALLTQLHLIDESGMINTDCENDFNLIDKNDRGGFIKIGQSSVILTQRDIRQFQLAKAAICAGILTMLNECNITAQEVSTFYLCGGFGSYINPAAAAAIGLIPKSLATKVKSLGNAAGMGAAMLFNNENKEKARAIACHAMTIELSMSEYFMAQYVEQMGFLATD